MRKDTIQQVIDTLPDDFDLDSFVDSLYLMRKVEIAEQQLSRGEGVSHEDAKQRLKPWLA